MYTFILVTYGGEEDTDSEFIFKSFEEALHIAKKVCLKLKWVPLKEALILNGYFSQSWEEGHLTIRERCVDLSII